MKKHNYYFIMIQYMVEISYGGGLTDMCLNIMIQSGRNKSWRWLVGDGEAQ